MKNLFMMIILVFCQVWGGKTESVEIFSNIMSKNVPAFIVIPDSYGDKNDSLPVILLLHGIRWGLQRLVIKDGFRPTKPMSIIL